jgi:predicted nucleotidyltransferase
VQTHDRQAGRSLLDDTFQEKEKRSMKNKYLDIARDIVLSHISCDEVNVFLFGSRAIDDSKRNSDVDIGFLGKEALDHRVIRKISDELEESAVPYHIDLVDFFKVETTFKKIALKRILLWNKAKNIPIN